MHVPIVTDHPYHHVGAVNRVEVAELHAVVQSYQLGKTYHCGANDDNADAPSAHVTANDVENCAENCVVIHVDQHVVVAVVARLKMDGDLETRS